jgi:hypothetical protein
MKYFTLKDRLYGFEVLDNEGNLVARTHDDHLKDFVRQITDRANVVIGDLESKVTGKLDRSSDADDT